VHEDAVQTDPRALAGVDAPSTVTMTGVPDGSVARVGFSTVTDVALMVRTASGSTGAPGGDQ
jgi:hypothetical protein